VLFSSRNIWRPDYLHEVLQIFTQSSGRSPNTRAGVGIHDSAEFWHNAFGFFWLLFVFSSQDLWTKLLFSRKISIDEDFRSVV
jgi:hypothetical protein